MISLKSILAITFRYLYLLKRDINLGLAIIYWPILDILTWGFFGSWINNFNIVNADYKIIALIGVLMWQVVGRGGNIIGFTICEELWSKNIVNLFSLPLSIIEWIIGVILFYIITSIITFIFSFLFIYFLYDVSIFSLLSNFFIFLPPLILSGIWLGFNCLQSIIFFGKGGIEIGFVLIWFLMPFSGVCYPINVLPIWAQKVSNLIPMSYVFEGMREYFINKNNPIIFIKKAFFISLIYSILSILIFIFLFNRSKKKGLSRLTD